MAVYSHDDDWIPYKKYKAIEIDVFVLSKSNEIFAKVFRSFLYFFTFLYSSFFLFTFM